MLAVVFPGQGSQAPGMGRALYQANPAVFDRVSSAVGFDVADLCFESDEDTLRQTQNAQIALYTVGVAAFTALKELDPDLPVRAGAGHSVGEYAALAAAGMVSVEDGARLVKFRGETMAEAGKARPGTMAAVLGLERAQVEGACAKVEGVCVVANDNCPGQLVISGDVAAVAAAGEELKAAGAKRVLPLNVSGAFHSPLMEDSAKSMGEALAGTPFASGDFPIYSNVTAEPGSNWPNLLEEQLKSPVRWTESVKRMSADGVSVFVECGHGNVLSGLIKRTAPETQQLSVSDPDSASAVVEAIKEKQS